MVDVPDVPPRKLVKIDCGSSKIAVKVPAMSTVADACAAAEARLTSSLGKRRIRTLALPDTFASDTTVLPPGVGQPPWMGTGSDDLRLPPLPPMLPEEEAEFKEFEKEMDADFKKFDKEMAAAVNLQSSLWFMTCLGQIDYLRNAVRALERDKTQILEQKKQIVKQKGQIDYLRDAVRALQKDKTQLLEQQSQIDCLRVTVQKLQTSVYSADQWLAPCGCRPR